MNQLPKIVFSRTLDKLEWSNSRLVTDDVEEEVARLKRQPGRNMIVWGSISLAQALIEAGQIQAIVGEIQAETNSTIIASEEGAKEVRAGTQLARGVVDALERISGMVDETTTAAKEISIATQQQRSASDQVVAAMTQVSDAARGLLLDLPWGHAITTSLLWIAAILVVFAPLAVRAYRRQV